MYVSKSGFQSMKSLKELLKRIPNFKPLLKSKIYSLLTGQGKLLGKPPEDLTVSDLAYFKYTLRLHKPT